MKKKYKIVRVESLPLEAGIGPDFSYVSEAGLFKHFREAKHYLECTLEKGNFNHLQYLIVEWETNNRGRIVYFNNPLLFSFKTCG